MITILSGTNRAGRNTRKIAGLIEQIHLQSGAEARLLDWIEMPAAGFDPEPYGTRPADFAPMAQAIVATSGLVVMTPEDNGGFSGVPKCFIGPLDHLSQIAHCPHLSHIMRLAILFLLSLLCLPSGASAQRTEGLSAAPLKLTPDQKEWLLATSAVLSRINHQSLSLLGESEVAYQNILNERALLRKWWNVDSREDLLKTLDWLDREGHRRQFNSYAANMSNLKTQAFLANYSSLSAEAMIQLDHKKYEQLRETKNKLDIVSAHASELGTKSIQGWDYARYVSLCRWGYLVGFLSEEEAWARVHPVGRKLQKVFSSWEDLGRNYLIGRRYWSYDLSLSDDEKEKAALNWLVNDPLSPWQRHPWNLNLEESR